MKGARRKEGGRREEGGRKEKKGGREREEGCRGICFNTNLFQCNYVVLIMKHVNVHKIDNVAAHKEGRERRREGG